MANLNPAQKRCRDILKMLSNTKDVALRKRRARELEPIQIRVADLTPQAFCALMQMKGAMPSASPAQIDEANRVFGSVLDRATKLAVIVKGLEELDEMGVVVFVPPEDVFCYPNLDLLTEVVDAKQLVSS